jgi:plasmid stabilization system protein ParE
MTRAVVIRPLAEADAVSAFDYYESLVAGLGDRFLGEVERVLVRIGENPRMYQEVIPGVRRALTRTFPYGVFYVLEPDATIVIAIHSDLSDPSRWQSRTRT